MSSIPGHGKDERNPCTSVSYMVLMPVHTNSYGMQRRRCVHASGVWILVDVCQNASQCVACMNITKIATARLLAREFTAMKEAAPRSSVF